jgi:SAM-dependent methyltransferase
MSYKGIKEKGQALSDHYAGTREYFLLSPAGKTLLNGLLPLVEEYCRGRVLDAGAGRGAYREILKNTAQEYIGMDVSSSEATSAVGDIQTLPFSEESFDTVFCSQVLEHVPRPWNALAEMKRVLKPGGHLILSVPHISWLHNEPHDYYRYTLHGLRFLLNQAGFEELEMRPAGGLMSLLGHIPSTVLMNLTYGVSFLHPLVSVLNRFWVYAVSALDERVEKKKIFALNYVCVFRKC